MQAFQISVNGQQVCTVSSEQVVGAVTTLKGDKTVGGAEPPTLVVSGMSAPDTYATWTNQTLAVGDRISIEVVDVAPAALTEPATVNTEISTVVEAERRAHYERLKSEYEPTPT